MSEKAYIFDVDESNFTQVVVENSNKLPVLVDFWADWCEPCKTMIPILHKLAEEFAGQFILAKVNADQQQNLTQQNAVKSLPTVKLIVNGEVVDEFTGGQTEAHIRAMLEPYLVRESDKIMAAAVAEYEQGHMDAAITLMKQAAESDLNNVRVQIMAMRVLLENNRKEEAAIIFGRLSEEVQKNPDIIAIQSQLEMIDKVAGVDLSALQVRITQDENDLEAREQLSAVLISQAMFEPALEQLLEIMKRDRTYNDDAGRKGLLNIFEMLGNDNPLVSTYRRRIATLMN
ncbi:MAG: tetratricopeptide repeat protein [Sulfuriflexus sp.]|nr:tetratricopeptide repeat protein [Sulfuriflexus sp.]